MRPKESARENRSYRNISTGSLLLSLFLIVSSCAILEQAHEYERFIQCDFKLANIQVIEICGVNISSAENKADIAMLDMMNITKQLFSGEFPAKLSIGLEAYNNDIQKAAIAGMDWKILMDDQEIVAGLVDHEVIVEPRSSKIFPVLVNVDLMKLLRSESLPQIMAFAFGKNQFEEISKLGAEIKIKPYYKTKSGIKKYPGYLTIRP